MLTKKESAPVVDFYARAGKLATVDGTGTVQEVRERIEEAISSLDIPAAVPFQRPIGFLKQYISRRMAYD